MTANKVVKNANSVDVLFILEGTFPYVGGGVSAWVEQLILGMPHLKFGAIFLGSNKKDYPKRAYKLPKNLVYLEEGFLFADQSIKYSVESEKEHKDKDKKEIEEIIKLHEKFKALREETDSDFKTLFSSFQKEGSNLFNKKNFLQSESAWEFIVDRYSQFSLEPSFIDYFWTIRNIHAPLWLLNKLSRSKVKAKVIHSPSTGYAGFLGALISQYQKIPLMVTEHGIYTRERYLELIATPLSRQLSSLEKISKDVDYLNTLWLNFFSTLARVCYEQASYVIALFPGAKRYQNMHGADPKKGKVIVNGIAIKKYQSIAKTKSLSGKKKIVIGLIGRLVRIKFTLNFIRAIGMLVNKMPNIEGWICYVGSEEDEYSEEAKRFVETLNLKSVIRFIEGKPAVELLKDIDLLVVSSISEGMPLNVLEAFAAGVPAVVANVGSCAELVVGKDEEDRALGAAGVVVPPGNVEKLCDGIQLILSSESGYKKASEVAQKRVKKYYDEPQMLAAYESMYKELMQ